MNTLYLYINQTFELAEYSTEVGLQLKFRDALILVGISRCTGRITREAIKSRLPQIIWIALVTWTWWNSAATNNKSYAICWRLYHGNYTLACYIKYMLPRVLESSWNVMAHGDVREGKWSGNWRMEWVASTLHTTSEHGVSSIATADAHISPASSRQIWRYCRFNPLAYYFL